MPSWAFSFLLQNVVSRRQPRTEENAVNAYLNSLLEATLPSFKLDV